ncbi:MAG: hypothetical protein ABIR62_02685 [Dokdonella sp.]|uniref:hypothetical protein n=1 Tax=Dokdonella sp. TaxID=2291710 RepID=UPI003267C943
MKGTSYTCTLIAALSASMCAAASQPTTSAIDSASPHALGAKPPGLAPTLASIQRGLNALQPFQLQAEFSVQGEDNEVAYVDRIPSRVTIDASTCMLSYPDQSAHEPAWSFADILKVDVQTDLAFHEESDARNGETRREISASPATVVLVVSMKPGKGWPMHVWSIADAGVAYGIANDLRRATTLCSVDENAKQEVGARARPS